MNAKQLKCGMGFYVGSQLRLQAAMTYLTQLQWVFIPTGVVIIMMVMEKYLERDSHKASIKIPS